MMHCLFPDDFDAETQRASYDYYDGRCTQGSSLSPSIHAIMGLRTGRPEHAYGYFQATALLDIKNLHLDKNLHEGIHAACAGGTWQAAVFGFGGVSIRQGVLHIEPVLPDQWTSLSFRIRFHGRLLSVRVERNVIRIDLNGERLTVVLGGKAIELKTGSHTQTR